MNFLSIGDLAVEGKRVLVRSDLNVPFNDQGEITDASRIERSLPTWRALARRGAKVIVMSHLGRPKGKPTPKYSLKPIVAYLESRLSFPVHFVGDCIGSEAQAEVDKLEPGHMLLLENVRFHKGEEKNAQEFASELAKLADFYVNDAFATSHRAHASVAAITSILPSAAGFLMEQELWSLTRALENPKKPVVAIASGAKVSTKLGVLKNLARKVDVLVLGGGMATTTLFALGHEVGTSLCEKDMVDDVKAMLDEAKKSGCEILLPIDLVVAPEFKEGSPSQVVSVDKIPADHMGLDIGPKTVKAINERLGTAKTLIWNGPLGVFEMKGFEEGTRLVAQEAVRLTATGSLLSVAGGGDTVSALAQLCPEQSVSYVSTAGGAFLEWMEGRILPGVAALDEVYKKTENMLLLKVKDIMTKDVFSLSSDDRLSSVGSLIESKNIRHVPIVNNQNFVGLMTHRDFLKLSPSNSLSEEEAKAQKQKFENTPVSDVMNTDVLTVGPELPLKAAAEMLSTHKYGCLPVVSHGELIGIITEADFVKVMITLLSDAEDVQRHVFKSLSKRA